METLRNIQFCTSQKVGFLLILFLGLGSCRHGSSSSSEVVRHELDSDSNNLKMSNFCSFKKYIAKSYFEKHESFDESNFQDFTADECLLCSCKFLSDNLNTRLSVATRLLIGEGSHRHLHSCIRLHFQSNSTSQQFPHFCKVIIIEKLPSGVFADPFELQHRHQRGDFSDVAVFGDTNLELPSVISNRSVVEIHMNVMPNIFSGQTNEMEINIYLPLHVRYPPLGESGYSTVQFGAPDIFMQCSIEGNRDNQSCLFAPSGNSVESKPGVVWRIPCGIRTHAGIVSVITFVTAFTATLAIVLTTLFYLDDKIFKLS